MNNNVLTLNIDSDAFSAMKEDFNKVLKRTLGNMRVKESDEATLTLKLSIKLTETEVPDFESSEGTAMKKIHKPRFDHKISSVMQIKTEESGSLKGEYELVWDDKAEDWVMKPIDNGQGSLFDEEYVDCEVVDREDTGDSVPASLPTPAPLPATIATEELSDEELLDELFEEPLGIGSEYDEFEEA